MDELPANRADDERDNALAERDAVETAPAREQAAVERERALIMSSVRCLLWSAEVVDFGGEKYLHWVMRFPDREAAQRFLPLDLEPGEAYHRAFYRNRLLEDRDACDAISLAAVRAGQSYSQEFRCRRADGEIRWLHEDIHLEPLESTEAGQRYRAVGVCTDITERRQREAEIETLNLRLQRAMTETHHRVKNSLQIVAALAELSLQNGSDTVPVAAIQRVTRTISALAAIHELLTQEARHGDDTYTLSVRAALGKLLPLVSELLQAHRLTWDVDEIRIPARQVTALAVLTNELLANAAKHGKSEIALTLTADATHCSLCVADDGPGFAPDFSLRQSANTGLELVESIGQWDLQGSVRYENRPQGGAIVTVSFPLVPEPLV